MALSDANLVTAATASKGAITHMQLHNGAPGGAGTANVVGTRTATSTATPASGSVDADGDITWVGMSWSGLAANQAITHITYWNASSAGVLQGTTAVASGDTAANAAGVYTADVTENFVAA